MVMGLQMDMYWNIIYPQKETGSDLWYDLGELWNVIANWNKPGTK